MFEVLFEQGNIWGILIMVGCVGAIWILQGQHEKGRTWARTAQYVTGAILVVLIIFVFALGQLF